MPSDEINSAARTILDEMLRDIVLSTTISAHREIKRGRVVCGICGTRCRSHNPLSGCQGAGPSSQSAIPSSRAPSPLPSSSSNTSDGRSGGYTTGPEKGTGGSTGIGSGSGRPDTSGNVFFACLICDRQVVSSRYAPHLSGCLGLNGSTRRTASRSAVAAAAASAKARLGSVGVGSDRGVSPYIGSEGGDSDDGSVGGSLSKKAKMLSNANGKRGISPKKAAPIKKSKMTNGSTPSPLPRQALPPSKLGRPPTTNNSASLGSHSPSPGPSIISLADSGVTSNSASLSRAGAQGTGSVGSVGRKTLPGLGGGGEGPAVVYVHDDDSDGDVDDY